MAHVDILDERESLRSPLLGSMVLHAAVFGLCILYVWIQNTFIASHFGDQHPIGGGAVGIETVKTIPLPRRSAETNPVANDTPSQLPTPVKPEKRVSKPVEDEKAVALLKAKKRQLEKKEARIEQNLQRFHPQPLRENQLTSNVGQALSTRMIQKAGSGSLGANSNSALGNQFGWYLDLVRQRISQKWDTNDIDQRLQSAPVVIVDFDIRGDGSIANFRITQRSNIPALDYSTQRAVTQAAPFPQLPGGYSTAPMEIVFQLQR